MTKLNPHLEAAALAHPAKGPTERRFPRGPGRLQIADALTALIMLWFSIPKLIGASRSVEGFRVIGAFLGVGELAPRLVTGVVELVIVSLLAASLFARSDLRPRLSLAAHSLLLATMSGAAFTEMFVRPGAANGLLALALLLSAFAGLRIFQSWAAEMSRRMSLAGGAGAGRGEAR